MVITRSAESGVGVSHTVDLVENNGIPIHGDERTNVAIIGGGASGTLTAAHLLRSSNDANLTEGRAVRGRGTPEPPRGRLQHHGPSASAQ